MGFQVAYLPPIHPIGTTHRKGPNNTLVAGPDDPGSPWAVGGVDGGHTAVHPELGTIDDLDDLVVLEIETDLLTSPWRSEQLAGADEPYPHVYGPVDLAAVVDVRRP